VSPGPCSSYHFEADETGRTLLRALRDAALRGVRVRLLIDDLYTGGLDDFFVGFAAHPNVEVRLFNPFCCRPGSGQAGRFAAAIGDWGRVNHRMHNKMFIADGVAAIIGGRNIANEYFLRNEHDNFIDMDAFTVGRLIDPLAALFDRYWNSDPVYPLKAVARTPLSAADARAYFERFTGPEQTPPPAPLPSADILATARCATSCRTAAWAWCGATPMPLPTTPTSPLRAAWAATCWRPASPTTSSSR